MAPSQINNWNYASKNLEIKRRKLDDDDKQILRTFLASVCEKKTNRAKMVVCGQQYGLKALRQAHLHRIWSFGTKQYSTKVSNKIRKSSRSVFVWKTRKQKRFCWMKWIAKRDAIYSFRCIYFHSSNNPHHTIAIKAAAAALASVINFSSLQWIYDVHFLVLLLLFERETSVLIIIMNVTIKRSNATPLTDLFITFWTFCTKNRRFFFKISRSVEIVFRLA